MTSAYAALDSYIEENYQDASLSNIALKKLGVSRTRSSFSLSEAKDFPARGNQSPPPSPSATSSKSAPTTSRHAFPYSHPLKTPTSAQLHNVKSRIPQSVLHAKVVPNTSISPQQMTSMSRPAVLRPDNQTSTSSSIQQQHQQSEMISIPPKSKSNANLSDLSVTDEGIAQFVSRMRHEHRLRQLKLRQALAMLNQDFNSDINTGNIGDDEWLTMQAIQPAGWQDKESHHQEFDIDSDTDIDIDTLLPETQEMISQQLPHVPFSQTTDVLESESREMSSVKLSLPLHRQRKIHAISRELRRQFGLPTSLTVRHMGEVRTLSYLY